MSRDPVIVGVADVPLHERGRALPGTNVLAMQRDCALEALGEAGAAKCVVLSVVATGVAVDRITAAHPDVRIVTGAIDPELDENAYIVPGLGDFGDRLFGTPHA